MEIIQVANVSDSVLLSLLMRDTEKSNISHAPSASLSSMGLGSVRDVASSIISNEQTQSNWVSWFQTLNAVFPKDFFSDYLYIQNKQAWAHWSQSTRNYNLHHDELRGDF